jgi:hypothetical protein
MLFDRVLDPIVEEVVHELDRENIHYAVTGVYSVYDGQQAPDSVTTQQIQFQIPVPSADTILDSCIVLEGYFDVTATNSNGDAIAVNNIDGKIPRSFPVNNMIDTLQLTINSHTSTHRCSALKPLHERLLPVQTKMDLMDGCPVFPETESSYSTQFGTTREGYPLVGRGYAAGGTIRRIDADLYKSHRSFGVLQQILPAGTNTLGHSVTMRYHFREPLFHPLLEIVPGKRGLTNVQGNITVNMRLVPNLDNALFYDRFTANNAFPANMTLAQFVLSPIQTANFKLLYRTIAADVDSAIPTTRVYPYQKFSLFKSATQALTVGSPSSSFKHSFQVNTVPEVIAIFVARQRLYDTANQLDMTGLRINSIKLKVQNESNILSSATPYQLYLMSLRNGLKMDWHDWYYGGKCIILVKPGSDFRAVSGTNATFNIQAEVNCEMPVDKHTTTTPARPAAAPTEGNNLNGTYELNVVSVTPSFLLFNGFSVSDNEGFSTFDVAAAMQQPPEKMAVSDEDENRKLGGSFNFKRFFGKVWKGIKRYTPVVNSYAQAMAANSKNPLLQGAARHAEMFNDTVNDIRNKPYKPRALLEDNQIEPSNYGSSLKLGGRNRMY